MCQKILFNLLRNSAQPQFSHEYPTRLHSNYLLAYIHIIHWRSELLIHLWWLSITIKRWSLHLWRIMLEGHWMHRHMRWWLIHPLRKERISVIFESIGIKFNVHLPGGILFLEHSYNIVSEGLVALHGNKSITKQVKFSACIISTHNP